MRVIILQQPGEQKSRVESVTKMTNGSGNVASFDRRQSRPNTFPARVWEQGRKDKLYTGLKKARSCEVRIFTGI